MECAGIRDNTGKTMTQQPRVLQWRPKYGLYSCVCVADAIPPCHFQRRQVLVLGKGVLRALLKLASCFFLEFKSQLRGAAKLYFPHQQNYSSSKQMEMPSAVVVSCRTVDLLLCKANSYSCFPTLQLLISATLKTPG